MKGSKGTKGIIIFLVLVMMLVGYYFYLSNKTGNSGEEDVETTKTQEVLLRDLSKNYPPSPKEVLKYYGEITQCFYNEECSEEEIDELGMRIMELYDEELATFQSEEYINRLKEEVAAFKKNEVKVSSYKTSNSTDVNYFTKDGYECASLLCTFTLRKGTTLQSVEEIFVLRKDKNGHWKIFGWDEADAAMQQTIDKMQETQ